MPDDPRDRRHLALGRASLGAVPLMRRRARGGLALVVAFGELVEPPEDVAAPRLCRKKPGRCPRRSGL